MMTVARVRMPENREFHCRISGSLALMPGDACLIDLEYGLDHGVVLDLTAHQDAGSGNNSHVPGFRVIRRLTAVDQARVTENAAFSEKARTAFALSVSREKGHVKVLHTRFSYGRDRLFIRYSAQIPVDLRRFVGQVQRDFKTQVDLWQVGVRDEAALLGCLGPCGRPACCCTWQRQFQPVNVTMAKAQEMALNPITLNGTCGRLKCCLRFEVEQYREAANALPPTGVVVVCEDEEPPVTGVVVGRDIMRGMVTVRTRDKRYITLPRERVTCRGACAADGDNRTGMENKERENNEDPDSEWSESQTSGNA